MNKPHKVKTNTMQEINNPLNFSFWETETYLKNIDLIIIGSGIVGLNAAISYKELHKKAKVLIVERGFLPQGASTKNAGFACFGSASELLSDINLTNEETVLSTVAMRIKGLELLRKRIGDKNMDYNEWGGYELFDNVQYFEKCADNLNYLNKKLKSYSNTKHTYSIVNHKIASFNFKNVNGLILNKKEGQINTGSTIKNLVELAISKGIVILNNINVTAISDRENHVTINTNIGIIKSTSVIVATNAFANELLKIKDVKPARAQVLITKPIENLSIKGTFHYDEGYYYFRNIGNRVLFGGGRNLDFKTETTTNFEINPKIQKQLNHLLKTMILPNQSFEIEQRWCGLMAVGSEKKPIIKKTSTNVVCAVRMGGMGVAIGSLVGKLAVKELTL